MNTLNISILPIDIVQGDVNQNLKFSEQMLDKLPQSTDIAVLPELFSTGFIREVGEASTLAEEHTDSTRKFLLTQARKRNIAICGSFLALDHQKLYNRGFFAEPNGDWTTYDKHHLFVLSDESQVVSPGEGQSPVIRYRGWNIAMAICYDTRFPVWLRNVGLKYDLLLVPANWPDRRMFAWEHLLQARAIENMAYVAGANRSGNDQFGCYDNLSWVFDYTGASVGTPDGSIINAALSLPALNTFREKFPFYKDADEFSI